MDYDLAIAGGGLAGSALGFALVRSGFRVLIVEREPAFRDRVRGEGMLPWGAGEARALGLLDALTERCALPVQWFTTPGSNRDLAATSPSGLGCLNFYHPDMQQCLLDLAVSAGAELTRPAEAIQVVPGDPPRLILREGDTERRVTARLVVGADGRNSRIRAAAGFALSKDPDRMVVAGTLYRGLAIPEDAIQMVLNPMVQRISIIFPLGGGRFRAYAGFRDDSGRPLRGAEDQAAFVTASVRAGSPPEWFAGATPDGLLASFAAPDTWAAHPYRDGVVLIGDAAAASDPVFGCGLSLTLRDVRVLRDALLATSDWRGAANTYAAEHDRYFAALHRTHSLWRTLFFDVGEPADARRARALPKIAEDETRMPDFIGLGPDAPNDAAAERRFFGEG